MLGGGGVCEGRECVRGGGVGVCEGGELAASYLSINKHSATTELLHFSLY